MDSFVKHYQNHKEFRSGLIVKMMQAYVMKLDGVNNPIYGEKVLNFFLALAASGKMKSFEFVSGNLCHMSKRHAQRIMAKKKPPPIINLTDNHIVELVFKKFVQIRAKCRNPRMRIAFTVGVDATVIVKSW